MYVCVCVHVCVIKCFSIVSITGNKGMNQCDIMCKMEHCNWLVFGGLVELNVGIYKAMCVGLVKVLINYFFTDFVTWQEFYIHFLLAKGHDLNIAEKQSIDYDTLSLDRNGNTLYSFNYLD